jgi:hypothetical protein
MSGHQWCGKVGETQNQGNVLGDRPCVRQSKLYRQHESGNAAKEIMGQGNLAWDTSKQEGAYKGKAVFDASDRPTTPSTAAAPGVVASPSSSVPAPGPSTSSAVPLPSSGHQWGGKVGDTQNQGNMLGDRPCVRQSKLYRERESGNAAKEIMGQGSLAWDTNKQEGAYKGKGVFDANSGAPAPDATPISEPVVATSALVPSGPAPTASTGHQWCGKVGDTQNQGNILGDRPCVRQSKLYRQHESGNAAKEAMGQSGLAWDTTKQEGAYKGKAVHDALKDMPVNSAPAAVAPTASATPQPTHHVVKRGGASQQSYNLLTGQPR